MPIPIVTSICIKMTHYLKKNWWQLYPVKELIKYTIKFKTFSQKKCQSKIMYAFVICGPLVDFIQSFKIVFETPKYFGDYYFGVETTAFLVFKFCCLRLQN